MKLILATFILLLGVHSSYASRVCKTEKGKTSAEHLANLDLNADLKLIDFDFLNGGNIVTGYEYAVEPAYTNGLYARSDKWLFSSKLVPKKEIELDEGFDVGLEAGIKTRTEATFVRFINDPCLAMKINPYSPRRMPLKASVALGPKFHVGDYFLLRSSIGFVVGADILRMLSSTAWGINLNSSYFVEGYYQLHIVRLDEKHIRFKVVGHRDHKVTGSVGLGWENEFDVFQWNVLNNSLEKFVNTNPVKLRVDYDNANIFLVDYILDLTEPKVVEAFEAVLKSVKDVKNLKLLPSFKNEDIDHHLLLDLTPLEALYKKDFSEQQVGRIKRNLRTTSDQNTYSFGLNSGNRVLGYKWKKGNAASGMKVFSEDDSQNNYLMKAWDQDWEGRFLYSWFRSSEVSGIRAVFDANKGVENLKMINLVNHIRIKKNNFKHRDFVKLKERFKKALPEEVYAKVPWENLFKDPKAKLTNFGLRYEMVMMPEVLTYAPQYSAQELQVLFRDYLRKKNLTAKDFYGDMKVGRNPRSAEEKMDFGVKNFTKLLSATLDTRKSSVNRLDDLTELRKNHLFNQVGLGFVMTLVPDKMSNWFGVTLNISSNETSLDYTYGNGELSALYKKLIVIKAALDDEGLDILREAESLSMD